MNDMYNYNYGVAVNPLNIGFKDLMDWNDLSILQNKGNEILNHGLTHKHLDIYDSNIIKTEIGISYYLLFQHNIKPSGYVIAYTYVDQKYINSISMDYKKIYGSIIHREDIVYKNKFKMEQLFGIDNIDFDKLIHILESSKKDYICFYAHNINKRLLNTLIKLFNYIEKNNIKVILPKEHE
jgi:hypothetical protein